MHPLLAKYKVPAIILAIALVFGGYFWYSKAKGSSTVRYVTAPVTRQTLVASIGGTGQVEASNQMDIKPQTDGRLTAVKVKQNQVVKKGDVLAIIDQQSAANSVAQARASLEEAQANYDKLVDGATQNTIDTQKLSITSAQQALDQAKSDYDSTVTQQQQAVDKAHASLLNSSLEADPSDTQSTGSLTVSGNYTGTNEGSYTINLYNSGDGLHYTSSGLGSGTGPIKPGLAQPIGGGLYVTFSSTSGYSVSTVWTIDVPNTKGSNYLSNLNAYNSALETQTDSVNKAKAAIDTAQLNLDKANLSLQGTLEPPTAAELASAKAQITSAQAQLSNAQTAYQNTILTAPFDGVIAKLNFAVGDKVTAGSAVATAITTQQVANITLNEVDAAKVKVGQKATLTFSAVPDLTISGTVGDIDNIGTVSQNVVNFTVKIVLDTPDDRIKPGMSVSASIVTDSKADVLTVPSAAIKTANGQNYVQVLVNGQPQNKMVITGLSNDTDTEVSGDIQENDEVVTQTITGNTTTKTTTQSGNILQSLGGNRGGATFRVGQGGNAIGR